MKDMYLAPGVLDYAVCSYGASGLMCRGPRRVFDGREHIAVLGGIETFGAFVERPFPGLLEDRLGVRCINLGVPNAGPDAWLADPAILRIASDAELTIIAVPGAHLLRNRFYAVHSRRNDRIVRQTEFLRSVFPELDLGQHHFVRHLLNDLAEISGRRFTLVRDELQKVWVQRMNQITAAIGTDVVLLWIGDRRPDDVGDCARDGDPPFVTRRMMRSLRGRIRGIVEVLDRSETEEQALAGKIFHEDHRDAALRVPGPDAHAAAARELGDLIANLRRECDPLVASLLDRTG